MFTFTTVAATRENKRILFWCPAWDLLSPRCYSSRQIIIGELYSLLYAL